MIRILGFLALLFVLYVPYSQVEDIESEKRKRKHHQQHINSDDWKLTQQEQQAKQQNTGGRLQNMQQQKQRQRPSSQSQFFINSNEFTNMNDYFSASWIQATIRFLQMPIDQIHTVESACFVAFNQNFNTKTTMMGRGIRNDVKMTLNWFDFSVEHLSKWWKHLFILGSKDERQQIPEQILNDSSIPYNFLLTNLYNYIQNIQIPLVDNKPIMYETIAVIAFMPFKSYKPMPKQRGIKLTIINLASTIASLYQAGFGRVVVVSPNVDDDYNTYVEPSFSFLNYILIERSKEERRHSSKEGEENNASPNAGDIALESFLLQQNSTKSTAKMKTLSIGTNEFHHKMEVGYVHVTNVKSKYVDVNVPMAALKGLQSALNGTLSGEEESKLWLGSNHDRKYWKYVYLTEPDTILQTNLHALMKIKYTIDYDPSRFIVAPHRFQPIPHQHDLKGIQNITNQYIVPSVDKLSNIIEIALSFASESEKQTEHASGRSSSASSNNTRTSSARDFLTMKANHNNNNRIVCCDNGNIHPGLPPNIPSCPSKGWWIMCGFYSPFATRNPTEAHERLLQYQFIRIRSGGTRITSIAGTPHGRKCTIKLNATTC